MSDDFSGKRRVEQSWEPGTLDATRRNIGPIDKEEAAKMTKILGGEIFQEKSAPIDYSAFPPKDRHYVHRKSGHSASEVASLSSGASSDYKENNNSSSEKKSTKYGYAVSSPRKPKANDGLPLIPNKESALMDKLMMSDDYKLKYNYGIFNFVKHFKKNGTELLRRSYIEYDIKSHIDHIQLFITTVKSIIQISPDTYKSKIVNNPEAKFKFLRTVGSWTMKNLKVLAIDLQEHPEEVTVGMMIPIVKTIYTNLLKIYYLGENTIPKFFKEIYSDLMKYPKADQQKLVMLSKQGITEWLYIYTQIIKGMYPLLMRMCSSKFEYFPAFFTIQTANILSFLELSKFDLLLPEKKEDIKVAQQKAEEEKAKKENEKKKNNPEENRGKKDEVVLAGIKLLEQLFPDAGFSHLESMPDMYPYFQPIYEFRDGYNLLNPLNPMQITVTLLKITEDLFQGCRNVIFTEEDDGSGNKSKDKLSLALNEWSVYREVLFEKLYGDQLRDFVNQEYSQGDFKSSLFGKKMITTMLWQTKFNFLPHFEFEQLLLEKPQNDSQYRPLCLRTDFLRQVFTKLSKAIDKAAPTKDIVMGISNPWAKYEFDIPTAISRRMDVLLGAKKSASETSATNANLIKYCMCIVSVLDWWINNKESPAYSTDSSKIYRVSDKDGGPAFSVPVRNDQNKLFAESVKASYNK